MSYAKLINNYPQIAPNPILVDGNYIGNPSGDVYVEQGYKPVSYMEPPKTEPGYIAVSGWAETENFIVQTWTVEPEPITEENALVRYSNELTGANDETLEEVTETLIKIIKEDK